MRTRLLRMLAALMAVSMVAHAHPAEPDESRPSVVEWAVSFDVVNHNRSATAPLCDGDGATYTIRGSLVGPPAGVQAGQLDAVTLYFHGSGDASIWHFTAAPEVDHVTEMARLGHASVTVHLPGYGPSDEVHGRVLCIGTFADHAQQVIEQLRTGSYETARGPSPAFERVALAGHSGGGAVAQLAVHSFHDVDALIVASWAGMFTMGAGSAVVGRHGLRCLLAPGPKQPDGPDGWAFFFDPFEQQRNDQHIDPEVLAEFIEAYEQDPCGWHDDFLEAATVNDRLAPTVDVPVLLATGERDPFASPAALELLRVRYERGSDDVSTLVVPDTQHLIMLERSASHFRAGLSAWLTARGF